MKKRRFFLKFKNTFWFLPVLYGIAAIIFTTVISYLDVWLVQRVADQVPELFLVSKNTAESIYTSLITALLTMTAISFSNIMVVLTTYSQQYSPRALQDFIHSRVTQQTLGIFTFGFVVSLLNAWFLNMQGQQVFLTSGFNVLIALISILIFSFFIHHSARWMQMNYLLSTLKKSSSAVIERVFKEESYGRHKDWDQSELDKLKLEEATIIHAQTAGYIQTFKIQSLIEFAKERNMVLKAEFLIGNYIAEGMPLFRCWNLDEKEPDRQIEGMELLIANERTNIQDIEFSIEKIVEIALKGISPSINDPNSTINAIHRIGELLSEIGESYRPLRYYSDEEGALRLILDQRDFSDYLYKSFHLIRHYGKSDISVMYQIIDVLHTLGYKFEGNYEEEIWDFTCYIIDGLDVENLSELDYRHMKKPVEKIASLYGKVSPLS